jgi:photosystem II stability/assembly factor-like uncharacterized protein
VRRSADGGRTWIDCALPEPGVFSLAVSAADGAVYAGTEPSRLFRSDDGGASWRVLEALLQLPSRPTWSFPPRPWTSHVRWIAPSPHDPDLLLVGIELGGLMHSNDGGASWQDHRPGAQRDVHSLAWHPSVRGRAYEAGGGGAAFSEDGGESWQPADEGRDRHYTWSVAVDPDDPELWYVSASTGPYAAHGRGEPQAHLPATRRRAVACARRWAARATAGDALCPGCRRRSALRRARRRADLGKHRSRRQRACLHDPRRLAHDATSARVHERLSP